LDALTRVGERFLFCAVTFFNWALSRISILAAQDKTEFESSEETT
jgi:hypothetical protein